MNSTEASAASEAAGEQKIRVGAYPYVVLVLLGLIYMFNYLDRQILSVLAEPIKAELSLSDTQLGLLSGFMFAVFYTTFGIPVAWLADRSNRVRLVAAACAIWSVASALCGVAQNFFQLALARIGVGIGEAGGVAPSYSILSDYFPPHRRGGAIALYSLGVPLGATAGIALGGWVAAEFGWRMAFFAVAAPGVLLSLLLIIFAREPRRGTYDPPVQGEAVNASILDCVKTYFKNPTLALMLFAAGSYSFVFNAFAAWAPALLMRAKGAEMTDIAAYYSVVFGLAMAIGMLASGMLADRYAKKRPSAYAVIPAWALAIGVPFYIAGLMADDWVTALFLLALPMGMNMMFVAPGFAIVQNLAPPSQRSTAAAILLFVNNLVGIGLGPVFVGLVSDALTAQYGEGAALEYGMLAVVPFYPLAIGALILVARSLAKTSREAAA